MVARLPSERLTVFVSSTIEECASERSKVAGTISELTLYPILFEAIGARPHPPREIYRRGIDESQVFVGIYRENYGWIADGMEVSGVEDEYRIALANGMPMLLYVLRGAPARAAKLADLIKEIEKAGDAKYRLFETAEELAEIVRSDLMSLLITRFRGPAALPAGRVDPSQLLVGLMPAGIEPLSRPQLGASILEAARNHHLVFVSGPLGCGKTVALAQLASMHHFQFLDASGLDERDLLIAASELLVGEEAPTASGDVRSARIGFREAIRKAPNVTLVIDGLSSDETISDFAGVLAESSARLVIGVRSSVADRTRPNHIIVPELTTEEVSELASRTRGDAVSLDEAQALRAHSGGNPLYLRFLTIGSRAVTAGTELAELEVQEYRKLTDEGQELVAFLAIAGQPLPRDLLERLFRRSGGLAATLARVSHLLRPLPGGYDLFHEHLAETIRTEVLGDASLAAYLGGRLALELQATGEPLSAYTVCERTGCKRPNGILEAAFRQAAERGDMARGAPVFSELERLGRESGNAETELYGMYGRALAAEGRAQGGDAKEQWIRLESRATELAEEHWSEIAVEGRLRSSIWSSADVAALSELEATVRKYESRGDDFGAARLRVDLSGALIRVGDLARALEEGRKAREALTALGDSRGARIAGLNVMSALSHLDPRSEELAELTAEVLRTASEGEESRTRAFICNQLVLMHRKRGEPKLAMKFAREAIAIGEKIGDLNVQLMNRGNLGNALRQAGDLEGALQQYGRVETEAAKAGLTTQRAWANELTASVRNEQGQFELAEHFALFSMGLYRGTADRVGFARACQERAVSLRGRGQDRAAADALTEGATAIAQILGVRRLCLEMATEALGLFERTGQHERVIGALQSIFGDDRSAEEGGSASILSVIDSLCEGLPDILEAAPPEFAAAISSYAAGSVLGLLPGVLHAPLVLTLVRGIGEHPGLRPDVKAAAGFGVLAESDVRSLDRVRLFQTAAAVSAGLDGCHLRCMGDGAMNWTVALDIGGGAIVTVGQFDDRTDTSAVTLAIVLCLKTMEPALRDELAGVSFSSREVRVLVTNRDALTAAVGEVPGLPASPSDKFAIGLPAGGEVDGTPMIVSCSDSIAQDWSLRRDEHPVVFMLAAELVHALLLTLLGGTLAEERISKNVRRALRDLIVP